MKQYITKLLFGAIVLLLNFNINAQIRNFPSFDPGGYGGDPNGPIVDPFGQPLPSCCENPSNGWEFNLSFGGFSLLTLLQSQIAAETIYRNQMIAWLREQENTTLLDEINRQMNTNYSSFDKAQKEYFKFYDSNGHQNGGVVRRAYDLSNLESQRKNNWGDRRDNHASDVAALDSWINCGFCSEFAGLVIPSDGFARSQASQFLETAKENFGEAHYLNGFHRSRAIGVFNIADNGELLNKLSDIRVDQYNHFGWEEKILLMSAYLVNYNLRNSCSILQGSCLPSSLVAYAPNQIWSDALILEWGLEFAPSIPIEQAIFNSIIDDYPIGSYGRAFVARERKRLLEEFLEGVKIWYLDNDGDGYHSQLVFAIESPGTNWKETTNGKDCDDLLKDLATNCRLELDDPCGNRDLRNKRVDPNLNEEICERTEVVPIPRAGAVTDSKIFKIQTIQDGFGKINIDQYELDILEFPAGITPQQLFEEIRLNFANFITGGDIPFLSTVQFEPYSSLDETTWNSSNPLGAAMDFDNFFDTSTVITTEYSLQDMFWTFTTYRSSDHLGHFVSGHRQFRLRDNLDGTFTFLIRAADRLAQPIDFVLNGGNQDVDLLYRQAGDKTWKNTMVLLENFINSKPNGRAREFNKNRDYGNRHEYNENDCLN